MHPKPSGKWMLHTLSANSMHFSQTCSPRISICCSQTLSHCTGVTIACAWAYKLALLGSLRSREALTSIGAAGGFECRFDLGCLTSCLGICCHTCRRQPHILFNLAVLCDSLRCGPYGTFCYGMSCTLFHYTCIFFIMYHFCK